MGHDYKNRKKKSKLWISKNITEIKLISNIIIKLKKCFGDLPGRKIYKKSDRLIDSHLDKKKIKILLNLKYY